MWGRLSSLYESFFISIIYIGVLVSFFPFFSSDYWSAAIFYYLFITISISLLAISQGKKENFYKTPFRLSFCCLFVILALRDDMGIDDWNYEAVFETTSELGFLTAFISSTMEPGYLLLNYIISYFTDNYIIMQVIASTLPLVIFYKAMKDNQKYLSLPYVLLLLFPLYFMMLSASLVRMFIALSLVFYSLSYLWSSKWKNYLLIIFIATLFHYSAFVMLPFVILSKDKKVLCKKWKSFLLLSIPIVMVSLYVCFNFFVNRIGGDRYQGYTTLNLDFSIGLFDLLPFILFFMYNIRNIPTYCQPIYIANIILLSYGLVFSILSIFVPLGRIIFYSRLALMYLFPMSYRFAKTSWWRIFISFLIILYSILYLFSTQFLVEEHFKHLFPYKNLFFSI